MRAPHDQKRGRRRARAIPVSHRSGAFSWVRHPLHRLHFGHLSPTTNEDAIRGLFPGEHPPTRIEVVRNRATGRSRGFAFVDMASDEAADEVVRAMNGVVLDGSTVKISKALAPKSRFDGYRREQRTGAVAALPRSPRDT